MPEKRPPVFLDYDQAALDAAYDQAAYAPNREQLITRRIRDSELARHRIGEPERLAYGPAEIERLDMYRTGRDAAPVFVFIHGGAWRSGRSKDFANPAEMFLAPVQLLVGENYNHFELPETLGNPYGLLGRAALDLIGLKHEPPR